MSQGFGGNPNPYESPMHSAGGGAAAAKVVAPAIALIVVGALDLLYGIFALGQNVLMMMSGAVPAPPPDVEMDAQTQQIFEMVTKTSGPMGIGIGLMMVLVAALIIFGGVKMKSLQGYGLAMTASILSMVPCLSILGCCGIGQGIGIWALIVLMNADVKSAFR